MLPLQQGLCGFHSPRAPSPAGDITSGFGSLLPDYSRGSIKDKMLLAMTTTLHSVPFSPYNCVMQSDYIFLFPCKNSLVPIHAKKKKSSPCVPSLQYLSLRVTGKINSHALTTIARLLQHDLGWRPLPHQEFRAADLTVKSGLLPQYLTLKRVSHTEVSRSCVKGQVEWVARSFSIAG